MLRYTVVLLNYCRRRTLLYISRTENPNVFRPTYSELSDQNLLAKVGLRSFGFFSLEI